MIMISLLIQIFLVMIGPVTTVKKELILYPSLPLMTQEEEVTTMRRICTILKTV